MAPIPVIDQIDEVLHTRAGRLLGLALVAAAISAAGWGAVWTYNQFLSVRTDVAASEGRITANVNAKFEPRMLQLEQASNVNAALFRGVALTLCYKMPVESRRSGLPCSQLELQLPITVMIAPAPQR